MLEGPVREQDSGVPRLPRDLGMPRETRDPEDNVDDSSSSSELEVDEAQVSYDVQFEMDIIGARGPPREPEEPDNEIHTTGEDLLDLEMLSSDGGSSSDVEIDLNMPSSPLALTPCPAGRVEGQSGSRYREILGILGETANERQSRRSLNDEGIPELPEYVPL